MPSKEVQSVLTYVKLKIAALQRKANKTGPPTVNVHAARLAKGLGEIEEALQRPPACVACACLKEEAPRHDAEGMDEASASSGKALEEGHEA